MKKEDLIELISSTLGCPPSEVNMQSGLLNHYLWDSLAHIDVIIAIESKYNIKITDDLIGKLTTVEDIYTFLQNLR